ncbi:hypothetical protein RSO68_08080 [Halomonas saccharevitans]|uniref:Uncharacterized protein n=1 Tax=Halomonas saccharevitans TaxID=416872 RepID=A0ABU3NE10_9GAMM|nr:hypothetical protein [Halomonas saccharevitans]MDT8879424.1 hypothetical protein [Halomonas saccharevitans]
MPPSHSQSRDDEIKQAIEAYLEARKGILALRREVPDRIGGKENIAGRIGQFLGLGQLPACCRQE